MPHESPVVMGIDASSTAIGYAVGTHPREIIAAGLIKGKGQALARVAWHCWKLEQIITKLKRPPNVIVIEVQAPQGPRLGNSGQATYGFAVGAVWRTIWQWANATTIDGEPRAEIITTRADEWTNRVSKKHRALCVDSEFDWYRPADDPGMDIADAVGLIQWWFAENLENLCKPIETASPSHRESQESTNPGIEKTEF